MNALNPASRILRFDGARNVRDLGGLPARGGVTRHGVLFRADGLSRLTDADLERLAALRLRSIIDLRYDEERERAPDRLPGENAPDFFHCGFHPQGTSELFVALNGGVAGAEEMARIMCRNYSIMPFEHAAQFRDAMHHVIAPERAPHLIHCASGKDRTGLIVAFLLFALGVERDVVFHDYELSNVDWQPVDVIGATARAEAVAAVMAAHPSYLTAALDAIESRCGSMDAYLEQWLGFGTREREALARLMIA